MSGDLGYSGVELLEERPGGVAPWEREGGTHPAPDAPEARARAAKWKQSTGGRRGGPSSAEEQEARRQRAEERRRKKEEEEAERAKKLEETARRMHFMGFFALPLVWLVGLFYFHKEHMAPDANPKIKRYYKNMRAMFVVYTVVFLIWFIVFHTKADTSLKSINILYLKAKSPNGF